jgi:plastocyanin
MRLGVLALVCALGCGSKRAPKTYQVEIRGMQFVPASLTVEVGDTITWTNTDVLPHTVTSGIPSPTAFDSKEIAAKKQWSLTVSASGDYNYVCTYHPTMLGTLTVR